jgi:hypothetical protein
MSTFVNIADRGASASLIIDFGAGDLENDATTSQHRLKPNAYTECRLIGPIPAAIAQEKGN